MELSDVFQPWANKINAHVHVIWLNCHHLALRSPFCTYVSIPHRGLEHTRIFRTFTSSTWMEKKESNDYSRKEWTSLSTLCVYMERDLTISPHWIRKLPVWQTRKSNINEGSPLCSTADLGGKNVSHVAWSREEEMWSMWNKEVGTVPGSFFRVNERLYSQMHEFWQVLVIWWHILVIET